MSQAGTIGSGGGGGGTVVNVLTANATPQFTGTTTKTVDFIVARDNLILGSSNNPIGAVNNVGFGTLCLSSVTIGDSNNAFGKDSSQKIEDGSGNSGFGTFSLSNLISGDSNSGFGTFSLSNLISGNLNNSLGLNSGSGFTSSESENITIGHTGIAGDSNVMRLGTPSPGSAAGEITSTFIAGIAGVTTSNSQIVTIDSTTGQLGSAVIPSDFSQIVTQIFTTNGTYTPTVGMKYCTIEAVGGGGGGGGTDTTTSSQVSVGGGGGSGGYSRLTASAATIGVSQSVVIGAGGAGGNNTGGDGVDGSTTTFGSLLSVTGGRKGTGIVASSGAIVSGGDGGVGSGGDVNTTGTPGGFAFGIFIPAVFLSQYSGFGGSSFFGGGGESVNGFGNTTAVGNSGTSYGGGGSGASGGTGGGAVGGDGFPGIIIVTEYI